MLNREPAHRSDEQRRNPRMKAVRSRNRRPWSSDGCLTRRAGAVSALKDRQLGNPVGMGGDPRTVRLQACAHYGD